jgi:hypothetical protein
LETVVFEGKADYIDTHAFRQNPKLRSVIFKGDIGTISPYAFADNYALVDLQFAGGITIGEIGSYAFANCVGLTVLNLPHIGKIDTGAFYFAPTPTVAGDTAPTVLTKLTSVTINRLTEFGMGVFDGCSELVNVAFGSDVKLDSIIGAFRNCAKLTTITIDAGNTHILFENGAIYNADKTKLLSVLPNVTSLTLPSTVKTIGQGALLGSPVTSVNLTNVEVIENRAFAESALQSVTFGASLKTIGEMAFYKCEGLQAIGLAGCVNLTSIGEAAFMNSADVSPTFEITVPASVITVGDYAFAYAKGINKITVAGNPALGTLVFAYCTSLGAAVLGTQLNSIGAYMFLGAAFAAFTLPARITQIGEAAFADCTALTAFTFEPGSTLAAIPTGMLIGASRLNTIALPASVERIEAAAFQECSALTSIALDNIIYIGDYAFCEAPLTAFIAPKLKQMGQNIFSTITSGLYGFSVRITSVSAPLLEAVPDNGFNGFVWLTSISLPAVKAIGVQAFSGCTRLVSVNLPLLESIGRYAFYRNAFRSIDLPNAVSVDANAFSGTLLTALNFSDKLQKIGADAFSGIAGLKEITVAAANPLYFSRSGVLYKRILGGYDLVKYPQEKVGSGYVVYENTVRIGASAFAGNKYLIEVTLPRSLKSIGDAAFYGCTLLTTYRFNSPYAPILESSYVSGVALSYSNFTRAIGGGTAIKMTIPKNGASSYEGYVYDKYFSLTTRTDMIALYDETIAAMALIDLLPNPEYVTLADYAAVLAAQAALERVPQDQKEIAGSERLNAALAAIDKLLSSKRVSDTVALIKALPADITLDAASAVEAARQAYDALSDAEKIKVSNYAKLTAAEGIIEALLNPARSPEGLQGWHIALIAVGSVVIVGAAAVAFYVFVLRKRFKVKKI